MRPAVVCMRVWEERRVAVLLVLLSLQVHQAVRHAEPRRPLPACLRIPLPQPALVTVTEAALTQPMPSRPPTALAVPFRRRVMLSITPPLRRRCRRRHRRRRLRLVELVLLL